MEKIEMYEAMRLELQQEEGEALYRFWGVCAELLSIDIDEFIDFMCNWEIEPLQMSLEELETAYVEYCTEFDIPCLQFADYACVDRMGW